MKPILCIFEQLSGMENNLHKSEVFCFPKTKEAQEDYRNLFGCEVDSFPVIYLGTPILFKNTTNGEWKPVEDRFDQDLQFYRKTSLLWKPLSSQ
jgi:hypothetical protein